MRHLLSALALLALAACAGAEPPQLFLLDAPAPARAGAADGRIVGLREIGLPLYARRVQIASQGENGVILADDANRWAEDPPRAATRLVARTLSAIRGAAVYPDPWPQGAAPDLVATVEVDRFLGALGGEVRLEGQLTLSEAGRRAGAKTETFSISAPVAGADHAALAAAYGAALAALAERIEAGVQAF
ncbi:MAG: membrane integrity-associated transporter subunit PqiC [Pikeienuella sp.]